MTTEKQIVLRQLDKKADGCDSLQEVLAALIRDYIGDSNQYGGETFFIQTLEGLAVDLAEVALRARATLAVQEAHTIVLRNLAKGLDAADE